MAIKPSSAAAAAWMASKENEVINSLAGMAQHH